MKREQLIEYYGKRITPTSRLAGLILIIAFGLFMTFTQADQQPVPAKHTIEQLAPDRTTS